MFFSNSRSRSISDNANPVIINMVPITTRKLRSTLLALVHFATMYL